MYESYASILESYMIPAEEGFKDVVKKGIQIVIGAIKKLIAKITDLIKKIKSKKSVNVSNNDNQEPKRVDKAVSNGKLLGTINTAFKFCQHLDDTYNKHEQLYVSGKPTSSAIDEFNSTLDKYYSVYNEINELVDDGARITTESADRILPSLHKMQRQADLLLNITLKKINDGNGNADNNLFSQMEQKMVTAYNKLITIINIAIE